MTDPTYATMRDRIKKGPRWRRRWVARWGSPLLGRLFDAEWGDLAAYNAERHRGVQHTPETVARMAEKQVRYDMEVLGCLPEAPRDGRPTVNTHYAVVAFSGDPCNEHRDEELRGREPHLTLIAAGDEDYCWENLARWTEKHPLRLWEDAEVLERHPSVVRDPAVRWQEPRVSATPDRLPWHGAVPCSCSGCLRWVRRW